MRKILRLLRCCDGFLIWMVLPICILAAFSVAWQRPNVGQGVGKADERISRLETLTSATRIFLSTSRQDSTEIAQDYLQPGDEMWHEPPGGGCWVVRKFPSGAIVSEKIP